MLIREGKVRHGRWFVAVSLVLSLVCSGCATLHPKPFNVMLEVDFGPVDRPTVQRQLEVKRGTTPEDLLAKVCAVQKGAACCDPREVSGINGVAVDPATNRWWTVSINGSKKVSPYQTKLKPGDRVRWEYRAYDQ